MTNGLKALLIAASTIITCIIVGIGFSMAREAKQLGNLVVEELHQYRTVAEERNIMKYDGVVVYGNDIVNLMKRELKGEKTGFCVRVCDGEKVYCYMTSDEIQKVQNPEYEEYIHPLSQYVGSVVKNKNEVIIEVKFSRTES